MAEIPAFDTNALAWAVNHGESITVFGKVYVPAPDPQPPRPLVGEHIRIIAEGVVTALLTGSDAVQIDHEECWWPYNGNGVHYEVVGEGQS